MTYRPTHEQRAIAVGREHTLGCIMYATLMISIKRSHAPTPNHPTFSETINYPSKSKRRVLFAVLREARGGDLC